MITDRAEWATLVASASGIMPRTPEAKRAWKLLRKECTAEDVEPLTILASSGSAQEQLAALWVLSFGVGSSLVNAAIRPQYIANLTAAFHRAELMSQQWYHARNCLYDLEIEPDPVDEDLQLRGLTREEYRHLDDERKKAELERRLPPMVEVATAVQVLVQAHPGPSVPTELAERLRVAGEGWRQRRDYACLNTVFLYVAKLPPATVSFRGVVDLLGRPNDFDVHKAYYGDESGGLVILANSQGTIDSVKIN